jgi:hypothetical protein
MFANTTDGGANAFTGMTINQLLIHIYRPYKATGAPLGSPPDGWYRGAVLLGCLFALEATARMDEMPQLVVPCHHTAAWVVVSWLNLVIKDVGW